MEILWKILEIFNCNTVARYASQGDGGKYDWKTVV